LAGVAPPRLLLDEMLGRLARYLRFAGCDAAYVRGLSDSEVIAWARREGRLLVTRDRALCEQLPQAVRIESPAIGAQWKEIRRALPSIPASVSFERCTLCNGPLVPLSAPQLLASPTVPTSVRLRGEPVHACRDCGHRYWEGSHTARVRAQIAAWEEEGRR
jgi:uncharacterized protein